MRPDLADVRLADRVFAPHYAQSIERRVAASTVLRIGREEGSEPVAELAAGDAFELLDVTGDSAWGIAPTQGLVGYLPIASLTKADT